MSKILMESLIIDLVTSARLTVKFYSLENNKTPWTLDLIMREAKKYDTLSGFARDNPQAYSAAIKLGIKETIQFHMKKTKHGMTKEHAHDKKTQSI